MAIKLCLLLGLALSVTHAWGSDLVERDTLRKTLHFGGSADGRRVLADIVNGSIRVTGYDGNEVQLIAYKTIRAETPARMEKARKEVSLDIRAEDDRVLIYEETPWRREDGSSHYRGWDFEGYDVEFEVELRVPAKTDFYLKTVNGDEVRVDGMHGYFEVSNVNGDIDMRSVSGSGKATTVNGNVHVTFTKNPGESTSFKTLNGEIDVEFPSAPSADFRLKTMNGEVFTDFDVKSVPMPATVREKRGGRKSYGNGGSFMVRSGGGGPELSFNTLNGDILLSLKGDNR